MCTNRSCCSIFFTCCCFSRRKSSAIMAAQNGDVESRWQELLAEQDGDYGEEFEAPNEFYWFTKMFQGDNYYTNELQELAHSDDVFLPGLSELVPSRRTGVNLQIHPGAAEFLSDDISSFQPGWYDIVYYCTASDDSYRNGRSNAGLMKVKPSSDDGTNTMICELRVTSQEFLSEYCGLVFLMKVISNGSTTDCKFEAPQRYAPDVEVKRGAKLRTLRQPITTELVPDRSGDDKLYGAHAKADTKRPTISFQAGDFVLNTLFTFMDANETEVILVFRKRQE